MHVAGKIIYFPKQALRQRSSILFLGIGSSFSNLLMDIPPGSPLGRSKKVAWTSPSLTLNPVSAFLSEIH